VDLECAAALVTGGASGLGRAVAERLAAAGAHVTTLDIGRCDAGLGSARNVSVAEGDVTVASDVEAALESAAERGPLRAVVNCAGMSAMRRTLSKHGVPHELELFRRVIDVNLIGTFNTLRLAAACMARQEPVDGERGVIVNTASIAAFEGQVGQAAYSAAKAGVVGLGLVTARDLADTLIRVVTVAPGVFDTPMLAAGPAAGVRALVDAVPHPHRVGRPDEFAALVEHIIGNPMINGEVIRLDGALRMAPR
jgi:NAD(P)-dependent dehydrogenase (short-subunit alcohol dehydrogenase family)